MFRTTTLLLSLLAAAAVHQVSAASSLSPKSLSFAKVEASVVDVDDVDDDFDEDFDEEDDVHRSLQSYEDPVWFTNYKTEFGTQLKRCKNLKNVAPKDGDSCRHKRTGDYFCMFGEQVCPADDSTHPKVKCDCIDKVWTCEDYTPCEEEAQVQCPNQDTDTPPFRMKCDVAPDVECTYGEICCCDDCVDETTCTCDKVTGEWVCATVAFRCPFPCPPPPPTINGEVCSDATDEVITVGEVECCGSVLPQWECTCSGGTYQCVEKNSPLNVCVCAAPECPGQDTDTPPEFGEECSAFDEDQTCSYMETCCCNNCMDSIMCSCKQGLWECAVRIFHCHEPCPPALTGTECKIEGEVVPVGPEYDCCGDKIPEHECTCSGGTYNCKLTFSPMMACSCLDPGLLEIVAECPGLDTDTPPKAGDECAVQPDTSCKYKEICCCNDCTDSVTCDCVDGTWMCSEIAFGCLQTCPPPISGTSCSVEGETFNEGEKECCGSMLPVWEVTCSNGVYGTKLLNDPSWPCLCSDLVSD